MPRGDGLNKWYCRRRFCDIIATRKKEYLLTSTAVAFMTQIRECFHARVHFLSEVNIDITFLLPGKSNYFYRDAQPAWLRKSRSLQRHRRALELLAESSRSAVTVARNHLDEVKARGCAYGDRLLAVRVLEERLECAENALLGLKNKGEAFVERQAETEVIIVCLVDKMVSKTYMTSEPQFVMIHALPPIYTCGVRVLLTIPTKRI